MGGEYDVVERMDDVRRELLVIDAVINSRGTTEYECPSSDSDVNLS